MTLNDAVIGIVGGAGLLVAEAAGRLVADAITPNIGPLDVPQLTTQGFTLWYAWYVTTRVIPKLVEKFDANYRAQQAEHAADRAAFRCHAHCDPGKSGELPRAT